MSGTKQKEDPRIDSVARYYLLGRSGLRVSPICLGTMTFGNERFGHDDAVAREIFHRYLEVGGNFLDTADAYGGGRSEELIGQFTAEAQNRDSLVIATKFNFSRRPADPNAGGNSRKHIMEAVEESLRRLNTDYIDLYWLHAWDTLTPVEEVVSTLDGLVRSGKIRYYGFSNVPGWYLGKAHALAEGGGLSRPIALQLEYSLVAREIEFEFVPAAQNLGLGITPWSPLASGLLTGKHKREKLSEGRLKTMKDAPNPVFHKVSDRNFQIAEAVVEIAGQMGRSPAEVAINWVTRRPGVTSTIIGARTAEQLESNLSALEFDLPAEALDRLDEVSRLPRPTPYLFFDEVLRKAGCGERPVAAEPPWFR